MIHLILNDILMDHFFLLPFEVKQRLTRKRMLLFDQIEIFAPSSTTRLAGILKKSDGLAAFWCIHPNNR